MEIVDKFLGSFLIKKVFHLNCLLDLIILLTYFRRCINT